MAWARAIGRERGPTALILTRQKLAPVERPATFDRREIWRGGYIVDEADGGAPDVILVATGSELPLAREAGKQLGAAGVRARVVSMPCVEAFRAEPEAYRAAVLPPGPRRVVIEAANPEPWCALLGEDCLRIGMNRFGASAPLSALQDHFGFTPEAVVENVRRWLGRA
jgi:transketolase